MKTRVMKRNLIVSIFAVMLLGYGSQGVSYGQGDAPTVTPGETNTSLVVQFQITLDEGIDENAYQIQLRQKSPQGEWITKCVVIEHGNGKIAGDPDVFASAVWISGSYAIFFWHRGYYSDITFHIKAIFTNLDPGTTYEVRYRDTNVSVCSENPSSPDQWSQVGEGATHLVAPPRAEFVDANLAKGVRNAMELDTEGGHIDLLKIPQASLAKLTELDARESDITDLTGLEQATQLVDLDLSDNQISDISPLAQLTQLTDLDLSYNQISDITPLAQLTQLALLDLRSNLIEDTSLLKQLLRENPKLYISTDMPIVSTEPGGSTNLYFTNDKSIQRVSFDGTHRQNIVSGFRGSHSIALDVVGDKIYWTNKWGGKIQRANFDGSNVEIIVDKNYPMGIALDVAGGKMYWTDVVDSKAYWTDEGDGKIQRANLDGTNVQDIVTGLVYPPGIALDVAGGKIYWTDERTGKIQRANLDGTNVQDIVTGLVFPTGIALDVAGGKVYWAYSPQYYKWAGRHAGDYRYGKIQRANLNGTDIQDIVTGLEARRIALSIAEGKIYWTDRKDWEDDNDEERYMYKIQRANLDGTNVQSVVVGLTDYRGIAFSSALSSSIVRDIPDSDSRTIFESSVLSGYTRVTLSDEGRVYGGPTKYTTDSHSGTVAYMLLAQLKGCNFARAELARQRKVYIKTQALGEVRNFASRMECSVTSYEWSSSWDGVRITHIRYYDENSSPNIQEAIYNVETGQYELTSITYGINAIVSISPTSVTSPAIGEQITLNLNITGGEAVAGYQATVQFDDTALRYVSAANGEFLPAGALFVEPKVEGNLIKLNAASLAGESNGNGTLATLTFEVIAAKASTLTLSDVLLSSKAGETFVPKIENAEITEPTGLKEDVNGDGTINIADLVLVAGALGETRQNIADVNGDGQVNIADLVLVAGALGNSAAAPSLHLHTLEMLTAADVKLWLSAAQQLGITDTTSQRGILFLQQLLAALTPKETVLLANYPNPFNPETWIPYHLAKDADVTLHIYAVNGTLVRTLALGHQAAGLYQNRSRAAYWDGKNAFGEPVASGVYFYTLTAGDFSATRKMLIRK